MVRGNSNILDGKTRGAFEVQVETVRDSDQWRRIDAMWTLAGASVAAQRHAQSLSCRARVVALPAEPLLRVGDRVQLPDGMAGRVVATKGEAGEKAQVVVDGSSSPAWWSASQLVVLREEV